MNHLNIMESLPHRYPFLLIDRIIRSENGSVHAVKNVSINEPFFNGHFPNNPVMPGVLIIEALAQASRFCVLDMDKGEVFYFASIEKAKFRKKVIPGDVLHLYAELEFYRRGISKTNCRAEVDGEIVAEAVLMFAK